MFSKNMKSTLIITLLFVMSLSTVALFADCDMMAMIAKKGHYLSWMSSINGDYNDPYDFFNFIRTRSRTLNPKPNPDGYGLIYYPEDGSFDVDNQAWYLTGFEYYYYHGDIYNDDHPDNAELNDAEDWIMDNDTQASIAFGHARFGTGGSGSHPFRFVYTDPVTTTTYTFMHNGSIESTFKSAIRTYLLAKEINGEDWFEEYPSNWNSYPNPGTYIDSELFFHYLMSYIIEADGDVIIGLNNALNETAFEYEEDSFFDVQNSIRNTYNNGYGNGEYSANFILSDGESIYAFRNDNDTDHSLGFYDNGNFIGIRTYGSGDYEELDVYELAVFSPYGSPNSSSYTRMKYFLNVYPSIPAYVFLKGEINFDIDNPANAANPFVWIIGDITVNSDIEITENTNIGVVKNAIININDKLTVNSQAGIHLNHASAININENGELLLNWGSILTGATQTTYEATPPGQQVGGEPQILGDRIIAQNGGIITTDDDFLNPGAEISIGSTDYGTKWDGISIQNPSDEAEYWFVNCDISGISSLSIENVGLSANNIAKLNLYQTDFSNNNQLLVRGGHELIIDDCDIEDNAGGILVYDSPATIENSTITGNRTGVYMNYACDYPSVIANCEINYNDGDGLIFRDRSIDFQQNNVQYNLYNGIVAYSLGIFAPFEDNDISNNEFTEYGGFEESYTWANNNNTIADDEYTNSNDRYILKLFGGWEQGDDQVNVSGNNISNSDDERFWPDFDAFYFGSIIKDEKMMFDSASDDMNAGNYTAARSTFEQLITDYPESLEAAASLQKIYFIENYTDQNYDALLLYIESIPTVEGNTMHRVKRDLITKTYMQKEEYNTAINLLGTVIADPANDIVLTDALIDQAYCYVKLVEEGSRALPEICTFKPQNFDEFLQIVSGLENKLYETEEPIEEEIIPVNVALSNYPNPFNPTTTINFSLSEESNVNLSVYNVKGQKVKQLVNEHFTSGQHSIVWNGKDNNNKSVASGLYFYKISTGESSTMKKMLLLK